MRSPARPLPDLSDSDAVARARNGDHDAFRTLVERYQGRAYRMAARLLGDPELARDAVQEGFLKAYGSLDRFEGRSGFYTWLYRLVFNLCIDMKRRDRSNRQVEWDDDVAKEVVAGAADPALPWLGQTLASLEQNAATLLVGSNVRKDQPLAGLRLRKAALRGGAVGVLNPIDFDFNFPVAAACIVRPSGMLGALAGVAKALGAGVAGSAGRLVAAAEPDEAQSGLAELLRRDGPKAVLLGPLALAHPDFSLLREVAAALAQACGGSLGFLPEGANSTGAALAGALPQRGPGGAAVAAAGEGAAAMLAAPRPAVLLLGIEPDRDLGNPARALATLRESAHVVALSAFRSRGLEDTADILLPVAAFTESAGTYVNIQGDRQGFTAAAPAPGEARPAWKVLRVLGTMAGLSGFAHDSSAEVRAEVLGLCEGLRPANALRGST